MSWSQAGNAIAFTGFLTAREDPSAADRAALVVSALRMTSGHNCAPMPGSRAKDPPTRRPPGRASLVLTHVFGSLDRNPKNNARHTLVLTNHDAAFFGGVRVGRTRTPSEIAWEWWPATDVGRDFFWLAV